MSAEVFNFYFPSNFQFPITMFENNAEFKFIHPLIDHPNEIRNSRHEL